MSAGVLLAAGLVHQLADANDNLSDFESFPFAEFVAGLTFIVFLCFEEVRTLCGFIYFGSSLGET